MSVFGDPGGRLEPGARLLDQARDAVGAARLGDPGRLLATPGSPVRASSRSSERLKAAGWQIRPRTTGDGAVRAEGVLLTATKVPFYCKVVYVTPGSGSRDQSEARVRVQLGKI